MKFRDATAADVPSIAALHNAASGALTARFGAGPWTSTTTERSVELSMKHARIRVGVADRRIVTSLRLATKKPWAIDVAYFTPVKRALYLTGMTVSIAHQGQGLGALALADAFDVATKWPADAIRLDAWDAEAGAGDFYMKCGFSDRGQVTYKGTPLRYLEILCEGH